MVSSLPLCNGADVRSMHCINVLMRLSFEPAYKLAMQRAHPDLL